MRSRRAVLRLLRNATHTVRVAGYRGRYRALVADVEDVLAGEAPVRERAFLKLNEKRVARKSLKVGIHPRRQIRG